MKRTPYISVPWGTPIFNQNFSASKSKLTPTSAAAVHAPNQIRLSNSSPDKLSDLELIEQILLLAIPAERVKKIAFTLIAQFGSYAKAIHAPIAELETVDGLGDDGIYALRLVRTTMIRTLRAEIIDRPIMSNWQSVLQYLIGLLSNEPKEKFLCLFLDTRNRLISDEVIAEGTVNHLNIYPREVIQRALALHASAIILVHNHPSGDAKPSQDDIKMTKRLKYVGDHLGIAVHDHIIIGSTQWYSFLKEGRL